MGADVADLRNAGIDADAQVHRLAQHLPPALIQLRQGGQHIQGRTARKTGVFGLGFRGAPHRDQLIADIIHEHARMSANAIG